MFKHILLPTDGSPLSENAVLKGIQLARSLGARVTGIHVSPQFHVLTYRTDMLEDTRAEYERDTQAHAERYLLFIAKAAKAAGIQAPTDTRFDSDREALIEELRHERERHEREAEAALAGAGDEALRDEIVPGIRDPFKNTPTE